MGGNAPSRQRALLIALIAVGAAVLLALIVLIVVLLNSDDGSPPVATPTPTPTLEETVTPDPSADPAPEVTPSDSGGSSAPPAPAPPSGPTFATFSATDRAVCESDAGSVSITWSWSSTDAVRAWFGIGTTNAKAEPFEEVPTTASYVFTYQCSEPSQLYTVTLEDASNRLTSETVEVVRE
ncbi:MAG: hypothetical protein RJQ01_02785 [Microcella sp.]|uniref:hypothetical protein n=1 Tax=Microcella sp. TaxID=1913979 RepID=UPI003315F4A8